jgi:hypothetical protein
MRFAPEEVDVVHESPPSLAGLELVVPVVVPGATSFRGPDMDATAGIRLRQKSAAANKFTVAVFWRRRMEAGGVGLPPTIDRT